MSDALITDDYVVEAAFFSLDELNQLNLDDSQKLLLVTAQRLRRIGKTTENRSVISVCF